MQRLASSRRLLQAALAPGGRAHSSLSAAAVAASPQNGGGAPKMPPFDYTPPPYDGPRVAEVARKRAEFLSPSLFHFYDRPVRAPPCPCHLQFLGNEPDWRREQNCDFISVSILGETLPIGHLI